MRFLIFFFVFLAGTLASRSMASSLVTPENGAVGGIARAMKMYQAIRQGQLPTNWEQVNEVYNLDEVNKSLRYRQSFPIQDHYQFITKPMPFRNQGGVLEEGSQVLLVRTVPLENISEPDESLRRQWRYLIVRSKVGEITATRLPEQNVQIMLKAAGVVVTPKPGLPAVETDEMLPEREPKPQLNPNDLEYLKQHPELDPAHNGAVPTQSSTLASKPVKAIPPPALQASSTETKTSWWLIACAFIIIITSGVVVVRRMKNSPPKS